MALSDKFRLPEFARDSRLQDMVMGTVPAIILFLMTIVAYLLRDVFTLGALITFHVGMVVFAWMTAWEMVGRASLRRSLAWAAAFALILVTDRSGMKPSIYIFWVTFVATLSYAWPSTRSFENGTENSGTLARDWFLGFLAGSAAIAFTLVVEYRIICATLNIMFALLALGAAVQAFRVHKERSRGEQS